MRTEPVADKAPVVLVTRPRGGSSDALCAAVRDAGFRVRAQPLLELTPIQPLPAATRRLLLELDRYQHVIFVSANAVREGLACIEDYWPQLPIGVHWYAVGEATARLLAAHGINAHTPGERMTSEGLLALPLLTGVAGQRVLIVKGEGGRDTLRETLSQRGAQVDELACYTRRCPPLAPGALPRLLRQDGVAIVLISSGEGLCNFAELLSPSETTNFSHLRLIVPSERVAEMARAAGFDNIETAENASDGAMLRALENCKPAMEVDE
ncbi:MAG: uroporphyrinogen-III synthase [Halioglobus sp.]|nr:uroporphyrinogen-III synthase [Halioglobus sp.]